MANNYLDSAEKQFRYYKMVGEQAFAQVPDHRLFWEYDEGSNSIGTIVKHMAGNMLSRWTDFLTADGEKSWRDRDSEFENHIKTREELQEKWEEGWQCLFDAITPLYEEDLERIIYIRNQGHTVLEAINRQLTHYSYHVGQIVYLSKMIVGSEWLSLSIPKGNSQGYNQKKFSQEKGRKHFTEEFLKDTSHDSSK